MELLGLQGIAERAHGGSMGRLGGPVIGSKEATEVCL